MRFEVIDNTLIVELEENIIYANSNRIKEEVKARINQLDQPRVLMDLSKVQMLDSSGLSVFISILNTIKQNSGSLKLCALSPLLQKVFAMAKLHLIFEFYPDREAALETIDAPF